MRPKKKRLLTIFLTGLPQLGVSDPSSLKFWGFYDPSAGRVLVNGEDMKNFKISALRRCIGYVGQEQLRAGAGYFIWFSSSLGKFNHNSTEVSNIIIQSLGIKYHNSLTATSLRSIYQVSELWLWYLTQHIWRDGTGQWQWAFWCIWNGVAATPN